MAESSASSSGSELESISRFARSLAANRDEPASTLHLLVAVTTQLRPTQLALTERGLSAERILQSTRGLRDGHDDAIGRAVYLAKEIACAMGVPSPTAAHLLKALLSDSTTAARRILERHAVDVAQLRGTAWNCGLAGRGRHAATVRTALRHAPPPVSGPSPSPQRAPGVTIPLFPNPWATPPKPSPVPLKGGAPANPGAANRTPPKPASTRKPGTVVPHRASAPEPATVVPHRASAPEPATVVPHRAPVPKRTRQKTHDDFALDPKRFPTLLALGRNLTEAAARHELEPTVGREREIELALDVLAKRHGNSPCMVGPSGVGKTSVVRGLAQRMVQRETLGASDQRIVVEVSVPELIAGTGVRGALAQRFEALRQEVASARGRIVVFFDEIHQLFAGDAAEEIASDLRLTLGRGELPCIGATTTADYRRTIDADPTLARRFCAIEVEEPSRVEAEAILRGVAHRLSAFHTTCYDDPALRDAIEWSVRYLPGRMLPDKAITIADLAGARAHRRGKGRVTSENIAEVVAEMASMPVERLLETDGERLLALESLVAERVVGHRDSIARIARILRRNAAGLGGRRPLGTFLLLGPTGVGKTETVKALAEILFHTEHAMVRVDMAEYAESHSLARLIGAPPGYVGHDAGGQLTESIRQRPYQVVLFDEIEKAHPDVLQSLLALLDEGRMTDGRGRTVDFTNTIIMMTSNLGSEHTAARAKRRVGFGVGDDDVEVSMHSAVIAAARQKLSPELYNRLDEVLVFASLSRAEIRDIAARVLSGVSDNLKKRGVTLDVTEAAIDFLLDQGGYDAALGARPLRRTVARLVEGPLAERILRQQLPSGASVRIDTDGRELTFAESTRSERGRPT